MQWGPVFALVVGVVVVLWLWRCVCVHVRVGGVVCAPRTHPDGIMPIHLRATGGRCLAFWLATTVAMNHSHRPAQAWGSCRWPLSHRRLAAEHLDLDARRLGPPSASSSGPHANTVLMSLTTFEPCDPGFYTNFLEYSASDVKCCPRISESANFFTQERPYCEAIKEV